MLKQQTITKLKKMNMGPVIEAAQSLEGACGQLSKEEWLDLLVSRLYDSRMTTKTNNLIKSAKLPCPGAYYEDMIWDSERKLDVALMDKLASCDYITKGHNVILLGASGSGKSWVGSALALCACLKLHRVECLSMPHMVDELALLRYDGIAHAKRIRQLEKKSLVLIDDWLLKEAGAEDVDELFAIIDARSRTRRSTIICSQYRIEGWPARMGSYPASESIVDRLKNNAYVIELKGDVSMREKCMDEELKAYQSKAAHHL